MKKESKLYVLIPIILFGLSLSMFATFYHAPEWVIHLPNVVIGVSVIMAIVLLVASIVLFIEMFSEQ